SRRPWGGAVVYWSRRARRRPAPLMSDLALLCDLAPRHSGSLHLFLRVFLFVHCFIRFFHQALQGVAREIFCHCIAHAQADRVSLSLGIVLSSDSVAQTFHRDG